MLSKLLAELWREFDIQGASPKGLVEECIIPIDDDVEISIKDLGLDGYYIFSHVVKVPEGNCEDFFISLMSANLFGEATGGAVLGMGSDGENIVLSQKISYGCSYKEFEYVIEDFCNWVEFWREEAGEYIGQKAKPFL